LKYETAVYSKTQVLLPQRITQGNAVNEKDSCQWQTSKNCAGEAPEGDSNQDRSALCNAGDPD
jgi:hypothetical protein